MALHLNGLKAKQGLIDLRNKKTKSGLWELIFASSRFWRRIEEKKGERARVCKRSSFGWDCSPLLAPKRSSNLQEEICRDPR